MKAQNKPRRGRDTRQDLMNDLMQLHDARPEFSTTYLRRMAITNFGAGHETMTSALTAALAMIGTHSGVQDRIAGEVSHLADAITFEDAKQLSYTLACIQEAQRLHPAIGMSLPRKVPPGGTQLHGYFIPAGTTVGCNPVSFHRNQDLFGQDAESFKPERWLTGDENARKALRQYSLTWGGGPRMCPGRRLAELIIHKVVPALLREFSLEVKMPPEEELCYYFVAMLTGVKVRFLPRTRTASHGV
jgi:cytochrome P450